MPHLAEGEFLGYLWHSVPNELEEHFLLSSLIRCRQCSTLGSCIRRLSPVVEPFEVLEISLMLVAMIPVTVLLLP